MKNSPKVSVIVPVFNAEKFLGACLESVLIQTLEDFEVLVADDCSTDSSRQIAESFLEKFDGRLKIISLEKNFGSAVPRNEGLRFSRGEYIFFMDADDLIVDNALEELFNAAEKFSADVVYMNRGFPFRLEKFYLQPLARKFIDNGADARNAKYFGARGKIFDSTIQVAALPEIFTAKFFCGNFRRRGVRSLR